MNSSEARPAIRPRELVMEAREHSEARRRHRRLTSCLALGGVIGPIVLVAAFTIAGALRPGYSPMRDVVSDLGLGPRAWLVNGAGLLNAALLTAWVAAFFRRARTTLSAGRRRLCSGLLVVPALGYAMASVFTEARATNDIHVYAGAVPALVAPALLFAVVGAAFRRNAHWRGWSGRSFAASVVTALLVVLTLWSFAEEARPGGLAVEGLAERACGSPQYLRPRRAASREKARRRCRCRRRARPSGRATRCYSARSARAHSRTTAMSTPELRYRAFISYSHQDERTARWLHGALERYRVPRRLLGRTTTLGPVPARISPVFRDREELPTATDLGRVVSAALEQSAALIVICSPAAAQSRWVGEEIRAFRRLGRQNRIFCVIVAGEPHGAGGTDCFPQALLEPLEAGSASDARPSEPIAADLRPGKDGRTGALLKIVAGLLGVGLDELARRDAQRRQRRLTAITAASVAGMGAASLLAALALISRNEAERQRVRAEVEAATAQQTSEFLVQLFQVADPDEARGNSITAREVLDRGALRIDGELQQQPVVRANLMYTMGRVYTGLGLYQPATDLLQHALALRKELQTKPTPESVDTANALGAALYLKGEYDEAEKVYRDALIGAEALHPGGDSRVSEALNGVADLLTQRGNFHAAEVEYERALAIDRHLHGEMHPDVARSLAGLAGALLYEKKYRESEAAYREALAIRRQTLGNDHPLVAETLANLGALLYFSGQREATEPVLREAVERYRHIFGDEHPNVSSALNNLGRVLLEQGKVTEAAPLLSEALGIDRKLKDPGHDDFVYTLNNVSLAWLGGAGRVEDAQKRLEEALGIAEKYHHRMLGEIWTNLADVYCRLGRIQDALSAVDAARPLLESEYPDDPWHEAYLSNIEGASRLAAGESERAGTLLLQSYPVVESKWGRQGLFTRLAAGRVARFYELRGDPELARRYGAIAGFAPNAAQGGGGR